MMASLNAFSFVSFQFAIGTLMDDYLGKFIWAILTHYSIGYF